MGMTGDRHPVSRRYRGSVPVSSPGVSCGFSISSPRDGPSPSLRSGGGVPPWSVSAADSGGFFSPAHVERLRKTLDQHPDVIQLITWNDYGEGTIIEPTVELGYLYLEMVQEARRQWIDPDFPFTADDLRIPLQIFELRQLHAGDDEIGELLDSAYALALAGDTGTAAALLQCISDLP